MKASIIHAAGDFRRHGAGAAQAECDIVPHVEPGEGRVLLEHDADFIRHRAGDRAPIHLDRAGARPHQPGDDLQKRALAAAGRSDHGDELAAAELEIERAERRHRPLAGAGGISVRNAA
jgi:hypothetical protein